MRGSVGSGTPGAASRSMRVSFVVSKRREPGSSSRRMTVVTVASVTVATHPRGAQRRPSGRDPTATDLSGRVVEPPIRLVGRLEQAELAGAGGVERVAVGCCVHMFDYAQGV